MGYTTLHYLILVLILLAFYYACPLRKRYLVLLAGSMYFYAAVTRCEPFLFGFFLLTVCGTYLFALAVEKQKGKSRKLLFVCGSALLFSPLLAARTRDFLLGGEWNSWVLPAGISFYTMQLYAYLYDVYRGRIKSQKELLKFVLFASWFPQIIQGPIPRYRQLSYQLEEGHRFREDTFRAGVRAVLWGLFLKFMIADHAAIAAAAVFENSELYSAPYVLSAAALYSLQLYTDFLSCTTLSQGVSMLFGIRLADNFDRPYLSWGIRDFWRRWHISLSSWLRDYVYIPLGGNRKGKFRQYLNIIAVFLVSGIWHGGGLQYIAWGLYHAFWQIVESIAGLRRQKGLLLFAQVLFTDFIVMLGWILFRAQGLRAGLRMWRGLLRPSAFDPALLGIDVYDASVLALSLAVLLAAHVTPLSGRIGKLQEKSVLLRFGMYFAVILCIWIFGAYGYGFDAHNFIYGGF